MRTFATLSPMPFCELRTAWVQSPALMPLLPRERHCSQGNGAAPLSNSKLSPRHSHHATRFKLCICTWMKLKPSERDSTLLGADRWSLSRNWDRCSLASGSLAPSTPSVGPTCCEPWLDRTIGARICMAPRGGAARVTVQVYVLSHQGLLSWHFGLSSSAVASMGSSFIAPTLWRR